MAAGVQISEAIAEMALGSSSLGGFEGRLLPELARWLGFDLACSVWSGFDGAVRHVSALEYSHERLEREFPQYMGELEPSELGRFSGAAPAIDTHVLGRERRERLTVYRELLRPMGVSSFVTNLWRSPAGCIGFHFARVGRARGFGSRDLDRLRSVLPAMKLAETLLATDELAGGAVRARPILPRLGGRCRRASARSPTW